MKEAKAEQEFLQRFLFIFRDVFSFLWLFVGKFLVLLVLRAVKYAIRTLVILQAFISFEVFRTIKVKKETIVK